MDAVGSECSSGCESGWTIYLDHSFNASQSHTPSFGCYEETTKHKKLQNDDDSDEEDLSMVSDASSGPPHTDSSYFNAQHYSASKPEKLAKRSKKRQRVQQNSQLQHLDDTASSPLFENNSVTPTTQQTTSTTESMVDYSQGFSATYFEDRSSMQDQFGLLQPSLSQNEESSYQQQMVRRERDGNDMKTS